MGTLKVYLDNDYMGDTPLELGNVKDGTHYLQGIQENLSVYDQVVSVKEGEVTTVLIERTKNAGDSLGSNSGIDGSGGPSFQALYGKIGYMSSYIYSYDPDIATSFYSSSLQYGLGYKLFLNDYVGILLECSRADFSDRSASWYMMPLTVSFQLGYPVARGFPGLYYYSLGLGYYVTNLEVNGTNLSSVGYNLATGFDFPAGEHGSAFIETSYSIAENSRAEFTIYSLLISFGYRLNI